MGGVLDILSKTDSLLVGLAVEESEPWVVEKARWFVEKVDVDVDDLSKYIDKIYMMYVI